MAAPMTVRDDLWFDEAAGPLVRPYAMTHGRTKPAKNTFDLIAVVMAVDANPDATRMEPEHVAILRLCRRPLSVAEIAAHLDIPVGVVKVLLDDLLQAEVIVVRAPMSSTARPPKRVLKAVVNGIRSI